MGHLYEEPMGFCADSPVRWAGMVMYDCIRVDLRLYAMILQSCSAQVVFCLARCIVLSVYNLEICALPLRSLCDTCLHVVQQYL